MKTASQWKYELAFWLGRVLAGVGFNAVRTRCVNQQNYCAKRRLWFGSPVIAAGNLYLKRLGAHTRILPDREWHRWESEVYRVVYDLELTTDATAWLLIPEWRGVSLATYLESESNNTADKLRAIRLATQSLSRLHGIVIRWPDGRERPLSHGDATVQNVIIGTGWTASWFDFDMVHECGMDANWRHADDLRALAYSAAQRLDAAMFPELTNAIVENYCSPVTLDALLDAVAWWRTRPNSFHLAQARLGDRKRQLLDNSLVDAIRCRSQGTATLVMGRAS